MSIENDRADIIELFGSYADIADKKDFDELPRLVHTDPFVADFQSVTDTAALETTLDDYVAALRVSFGAFVATHHTITGHVIRVIGDHATAHAHVRAEHWVSTENTAGGPNCWLVVGFYDNEAVRTDDGWRFSRVTLTAVHQENTHLLEGSPG